MNYNEISKYFSSRQESFNSLLSQLVDLQSYSKEKQNINKLLDFIELRFSCFNPQKERIETPIGDLLVLTFFADKPEFSVMLSHIDTVRVSEDPPASKIVGNRLFGSGSYDMKNAVAMFWHILDLFSNFSIFPNKTLKLILTPDEEIGSKHSSEHIINACYGAKGVVIAEPCGPNGAVKIKRKGIALLNAIITGKPAHSGIEPERGADANKALVELINKINHILQKYPDIYFNPGVLAGGVKVNVVSPDSWLDSEMRSFDAKHLVLALDEIKKLECEGAITLKIFTEMSRFPLEFTDANRRLYDIAKRVADEIDYPLGTCETGGSSDGSMISPLGIPVIDGLGLKGSGAHTLEEYVELSDFPQRASVIAGLILEM